MANLNMNVVSLSLDKFLFDDEGCVVNRSTTITRERSLLLLFCLDLSLWIGETDVEFSSAFDDCDSLVCGDVLGDFTAEVTVVHEEDLKITFVVDQEFLEAVWKHESGLFV